MVKQNKPFLYSVIKLHASGYFVIAVGGGGGGGGVTKTPWRDISEGGYGFQGVAYRQQREEGETWSQVGAGDHIQGFQTQNCCSDTDTHSLVQDTGG